MNRRALLTRLSSGVVGLSLVDIQWVPGAITSEIPLVAALTNIEAITAECLRCVVNELPQWRGAFVPGDYTLGFNGMNAQYGIDLEVSDVQFKYGINPVEFLVPAASRLATEIERHKITSFGALGVDIPNSHAAVATDEGTGITVRGVQYYDIWPRWIMRFDVLGKAAN